LVMTFPMHALEFRNFRGGQVWFGLDHLPSKAAAYLDRSFLLINKFRRCDFDRKVRSMQQRDDIGKWNKWGTACIRFRKLRYLKLDFALLPPPLHTAPSHWPHMTKPLFTLDHYMGETDDLQWFLNTFLIVLQYMKDPIPFLQSSNR
jgi:hypothetical protein